MSKTTADLNIQSVSICAYADYEGGEELIEYFKGIRDIPTPPEYSNKIIDINEEELADSELLFGPSGSDPPSESGRDRVEVNVVDGQEDGDDDEYLHIHMDATGQAIEHSFSIFKDAVAVVDEAEIHVTGIEVALHSTLSELELPIEVTGDYNLNGGRLTNGKKSYLLQELEDGEHTMIRHGDTEWYYVDADAAEDLIEQMADRVEEFLERIKQ